MDLSLTIRWTLLVTAVLAFILGPFLLFGAAAEPWMEGLVVSLQERPFIVALVVVGLLAVDIVAPVPSSIVSTLAGAFLGVFGGAVASFIGLSVGCMIGYGLGKTAGRAGTQKLLYDAEIVRLEAGWVRFGDGFLVIARAVPVLAEASVLFAGMSKMSRSRFILLTSLANAGISLVYATVGAWALNVQSFFLALAVSIALPAAAMFATRSFRKAAI